MNQKAVRSWKVQSSWLVTCVGVLGLFILPGDTSKAGPTWERAPAAAATLTHGPVVGGVSDSGAVVFVRTSAAATVRVAYSRDPSFQSDLRFSLGVKARNRNDYTVHVRLKNLQPATSYFYQVRVDGRLQALPVQHRFTTAPVVATSADFRFAVFSDLSSRPEVGAPAYQSAASDNPAFVLQIGDFDHRAPGSPLRPSIDVDNWRKMHRDVLHDNTAGQQFARYIGSSFPFYHTWDDHDYGENDADRTAWWRNMAQRAFLEYFPLPPLPNREGGLWYSFRYAQVEIFMLDSRSQRDPAGDPLIPSPSMLDGGGLAESQKDWLMAGLLASPARWKPIVSSSAWNPTVGKPDSWHGYVEEQNELAHFIQDNGISGVIFLSGDLHSGGAIDDGTNSYFPELSVPTTNISGQADCAGGDCGVWSEGLITGGDPSGYALVHVTSNGSGGTEEVVLQVRAEDGSLRLEHRISLP